MTAIDPGLASVLASSIAAFAALGCALVTRAQGRKINETHKQVTVNHHSSEFPTVLDRIDDVKQLVLGQGVRLNDHISHSNEMDLRLMAVESEVRQTR